MELTAPWKDMRLSIDGGVVVNSTPTSLLVRFPAAPADVWTGLHAALAQDLAGHGWTEIDRLANDSEIETAYETPLSKEGGLIVNLHDGRPQAMLKLR